jgi:hypothetical protein
MADLSSILGGMVQGFKDFGTGLVDMFGTGGAAIGDAIASIQTGRATTKNQDDFRKWLYNTDSTKDAAAKGLGTALNGVSTVADVIPGAQAVTANPLFNGIQGAIGGVSDELKMAGENADWGKAAQRAGVGAASGLASGYAGQALGKSGNKLLSNGLTRGAVSGALGGGIANAGYTGIEGGSVQDMINAGLYGAQTGALVGGTTGLARELIKPTHKMDVAMTDDERKARLANIDDQLAKLDTSTQEGIDRHNELMTARIKYEQPETSSDYMMAHRPTQSGIYADDLLAEGVDGMAYPKDVYDKPQQYTGSYGDNAVLNETMAQLNAVRGNPNGEITIYRATPGDTINDGDWITLSKTYADMHNNSQLGGKGNVLEQRVSVRDVQPAMDDLAEWGYFPQKKTPANVADLMNEPKPKTVADLMLSPEQEEYFKNSQARDASGNLKKLYHGSANGEFDTFSKEFANAENDWGKGFYFTDNEADVKKNYYDGGPDFDNKIARRAEQLEAELDIPYEQAEKQARNELYKGAYQIDAYTNLENPATVGKTVLFDGSEYPIKNLSDYDGDTEGYYQDLIYDLTDNVLADTDTDYRYHDDLMRTLYDAYAEGGVEPQRLKEMLNELEITDDNGNLVGNEIARSVIQNLGFDGIIDPTVANKFKNMGIDQNTTHYIAFEPNQIKSVKNKKPTKSANINYGLAGLLGTGGLAAALAAATPKDDKKKKSEVK